MRNKLPFVSSFKLIVPVIVMFVVAVTFVAKPATAQESPVTPPITPPTTPTPTPTPPVTPPVDDSPAPNILSRRLHQARVDRPYRALVRVMNNSVSAVQVEAHNLPDGLELDRCRTISFFWNARTHCVIQGKPTESGEFDVEIVAMNQSGQSDSEMMKLDVRDYRNWFWSWLSI